jgi:hypothetical protein
LQFSDDNKKAKFQPFSPDGRENPFLSRFFFDSKKIGMTAGRYSQKCLMFPLQKLTIEIVTIQPNKCLTPPKAFGVHELTQIKTKPLWAKSQ